MSLCDVCLSPGACCKAMVITGGRTVDTRIDAPMSRERAEHVAMMYGLPFIPGRQRPDGIWQYTCTNLDRSGRCRAYEDRPQLCRDFKPGEDPLCVHYWADPEMEAKAA